MAIIVPATLVWYEVLVDLRPSLMRWLDGADAEHPIKRDMQYAGLDELLDRLDDLFRQLGDAAPHRLDGKRRDFRALRDPGRWHDLLSELVFARWLVEHGVDFEFGAAGSPQPDLVLPTYGFGIEITRRERRPVCDLQWALYQALKNHPNKPKLVLLLSAHPLAVRQKVVDSIIDEVIVALSHGETQVHAVLRPARDGHAAITAKIDLRGGCSRLPHIRYSGSSSRLDATLLDIEDMILASLEEERKTRQGASMPSLLVVDVSHLPRPASLRPNRVWAPRLAALLKTEHSYIAVAVMFASVWESPSFVMGIGPHAQPQVAAKLLRWGECMGLHQTK